MFRPLLNNVNYKINTVINKVAEGINTFLSPFEILDGEATDLSNLSDISYPALTVRQGRQKYATALTTPNAMGQRNNQYVHVVDGTVWKYWNSGTGAYVNVKTGLTSALGSFEEFSTGTTKYTIFANGTDKYSWDGTNVVSLTAAPSSKIFTTHKGRVYWARDNDIVYSALNLINDYTAPNDAGTIDVTRAKGAITAMYEYNSRVVCFTEFSMHELYGTSPDTFDLIDIEGDVGCISDRSLIVANKRLYWIWHDGVYEYAGATIVKVSEPYADNGVTGGVTRYIKGINLTYKEKIVSGAIGDYLYMAIPYGASATTNNLLLVFNTKLRKWYVESGNFVDFETIGNTLYGIDSTGQAWNMLSGTDDDGTAISWYYITKAYNDAAISQKKVVSDIWVTVDLPVGSTLNFYTSNTVDNDDFVLRYTFTANADEQNTRIILPTTALQNVDYYRFKFSGTGPCTIYYFDKKTRIKVR